MTMSVAFLLFFTALIGGALNSVAGGGSFFTFPTLIFTGLAPIAANATSTVALWPGSVASIAPYKDTLNAQRRTLYSLAAISLAGGIVGSLVLINTPQSAFKAILPFLLLIATVIFAFGGNAAAYLRKRFENGVGISFFTKYILPIFQFIIALYGGYFGGGIGILMLALFAVMEMKDIHTMNALKVILASSINGVAVIIFIAYGIVHWPQALVMAAGAIAGGYFGAFFAQKIPSKYVRVFVILVGVSLTIYFFAQNIG